MRRIVGLWLLAASLFASFEAFAEDDAKAEAKGHFEAGLALFKAEKYDAAALELEASVRLYPTKSGLFNLANIYKIQSRYDEAVATIDRLVKEHGGGLDAEMERAVGAMRDEIEKLAARLEISVNPLGAIVAIDGREVGRSPLSAPLRVDPGEHSVRGTLEGFEPAEAKIRVISRETARVALTLEREEPTQVPAPYALT